MSEINKDLAVVTERRLQSFYEQIKPYLGYIAEQIQYSTVPQATEDLEDKIIQYIGDTDQNYINGRFYKCIYNATDDEYLWININPSGQNGHNIKDSSGTDLSFRSVMQFAGDLEATDDSVNDKTIIAPHLLTNNDFDEIMATLPGQRSNSMKYSTTEQVVGEWIDGKPIYQKVFQLTSTTNNMDNIDATSLNIDCFIDGFAHVELVSNNYTYQTVIHSNSSNNYIGYDATSKKFYGSHSNSATSKRWNQLVVQYTKTTDIIAGE